MADTGSGDLPPRARLPLLALGFVALLIGIFSGLARLGVTVDAKAASLAAFHGPMMIAGFFGVVIALERAVATARLWAYAAPLLAGLGAIGVFAGRPSEGAVAMTAGAVALVIASIRFVRIQPALHTATVAAGAIALAAGNGVWAATGRPSAAVPAWIAFIVLTIAGERLELTRFLPRSEFAQRAFAAIVAAIAAAMALSASPAAARAFGVALLALSAWLYAYDLARRTIRDSGLTRYTAACLLSGYVWLAIGGAIVAAAGLEPGTRAYDAALHALFVGFVFSMVFGHAPIIFPAVLRVKVPYSPAFYAPVALLHASVALRLAADAADAIGARQAGAIGNALAIGLFIVTAITAVVRGRRQTPQPAR